MMSAREAEAAPQPVTDEPQDPQCSKALSVKTVRTCSSRSSATVKAQKAAAEALALRRRLERKQQLADKERERERELTAKERERELELAELQQRVEDIELQAELAAIEADAADGSRPGSRVSIDRTSDWVENHYNKTKLSNHNNGNRDTVAVRCEPLRVPSPGRLEHPPTTTRATASPIFPCIVQKPQSVPVATGSIKPSSDDQREFLQAVADTAAAAKAVASVHVKKPELFVFSGNTSDWLHFKRVYDLTKHSFSDLENFFRLQNVLRGAAREAVSALLLSTEDPEEVMRALEENFARPELIVYKEVSSLKNLPRIGNDLKELGTLSNQVRNSVATIKILNQVEYLYSPELFHAVLNKLNPTIKMRWTDFASQDNTERPKLEILSDFLKRELNQHIRFGLSPETSSAQPPSKHSTEKQHNNKRESVFFGSSSKEDKKCCVFCKEDHNIKVCSKFALLSVDERWQWLRGAKACYRCLKLNSHQWKTCKVKPCGVDGCLLRHHALLHSNSSVPIDNRQATNTCIHEESSEQNVSKPSEEKVTVSATSTSNNVNLATRPRAYLKIVPVTVSGPLGTCDTYALLDDGSTATLIDSSIATRIGATGPKQTITVNGIGGLERVTSVSYVDFRIKGRHTQENFVVKNARAMESLSLRPQTIEPKSIESFSYLTDLVDILTYEDATPTILIGAEHWHLSINREVRVGKKNEPVACLTALGWTLYGVASSKTQLVDFVNHGTFLEPSEDDKLEFLIREQYNLDSLGISKKETLNCKEDQRAVEFLEATSKRLPSGRFEVGLPWRHDIQRIPDSYPQALSRFLSLEKRMARDPDFATAYEIFINSMISSGYAEECVSETYYKNHTHADDVGNFGDIRYYLPHFGVYHPQKRKLRVVHDAAAMSGGVSLNSLLLSGPDLLQPLIKILFRFRESQVALTADIKEMFPQIRIREQDRDALRFLWRSDKTKPLKEFRMTSVIFGACCSPFIAQFIKNKNAQEYADLYPKAADAILFNHYMDDYIDSQDSVDESAQLAADIVSVHGAACFEMRGWVSNEPAALKLIPNNLRAAQQLEMELGKVASNIRALGMSWDPLSDNLGFRTGVSESLPSPITKRKVLSHLMRVYDPLGLLGPIVLKGRILFQQTWRSNVDWDSELPEIEASKWSDWFKELTKISSLKIPRWYSKANESEPSYRELHIFADASELAYACVAYWRLIYPDGSVKLTLISSKARVSPLKPMSIPRLELQAALIASRLALTIKDSHRKKPVRTFFWSDSMTVLQWLRSDARTYKPFVAHRLGEILENSCIKDWRWVPTDLNVADDATRLRPLNLDFSHRWFTGPPFLLSSSNAWPIEPVGQPKVQEELKRSSEPVAVHLLITVDLNRFDNWFRLVRANARLLQAAAKFRHLLTRNTLSTSTTSTVLDPISAELMEAAERHVIKRIQEESFEEEIQCLMNNQPMPRSSRLFKLSPVLGQDNLLRMAGRIRAVQDVDRNVITPILLDGRHPIVHLLVQHYHRAAGHANVDIVLNEMRQKYWILHMRNTIRSVTSHCLFCRIKKAKPMNPMTGDLPPYRLAHHRRPFTFTGLDYFGPLTVTIGRRREKRYVALFTCMTSRAVHLELVHNLSASSAIMSIRRFIARRGTPESIYSDNGTNFVGANRILKEFYQPQVQDFSGTHGIKWCFIPAAAPFFGGCWERLVRSVKTALSATLHERAPKEEILVTLLLEAEAIVNSRPLSHVSLASDSEEALTPFHFLIGSSSNQIPPRIFDDGVLLQREDWRKALKLADHFWSRWVREVLPTMQPRQVGRNIEQNLAIGDVVLVVDGNLPRGTWPRGRVAAIYPGRDGVVRVVDVATAGGLLRRPTKKLVRLNN